MYDLNTLFFEANAFIWFRYSNSLSPAGRLSGLGNLIEAGIVSLISCSSESAPITFSMSSVSL